MKYRDYDMSFTYSKTPYGRLIVDLHVTKSFEFISYHWVYTKILPVESGGLYEAEDELVSYAKKQIDDGKLTPLKK